MKSKYLLITAIIILLILIIGATIMVSFWKKDKIMKFFQTEQKNRPKPVSVNLTINIKGQDVFATLTFSNNNKEYTAIEKFRACLGNEIETDVFEITAENGEKISWGGLMAEEGNESGPERYQGLKPGQSIATTIKLNEAYNFLHGRHTYKIKYSAYHRLSVFLLWLRSNEASFEYETYAPFKQ